jgi:small subunit ribosomal protein S16
MATRIRLRRMGANKRPFYRVVVADQRSPRDGRFIENIGKYHPLEDPSLIEIDEERALHWLRVGAQPSSQVRNLMVKTGIWDKFVAERPSAAKLVPQKGEKPAKAKLSKKAAAKAAEAATAAQAPAEATVEAGSTDVAAPEVVEIAEVEAVEPVAVEEAAQPEADEGAVPAEATEASEA